MVEPGGPEPADAVAAPHADDSRSPSPPGPWRRAALLGCAALLAGSLALTGTSAPEGSPGKYAGQAYLSDAVELEAQPAALPRDLPAPGMGMTLAARSTPVDTAADTAAVGKAPQRNPFTGEDPVCASYPVAPGSFRLSSPYGYRVHPIFGSYLMHMGVDYAAPLGTPIHAVTDGTVVYTGPGRLGRSSELVIIEHTVQGTTFYSWYVHMYPDGVFVDVGQRVWAGDVIAEVGNNGNSTGPHLHFEIHIEPAGLGPTKAPQARRTVALTTGITDALTDPGGEPTDPPSDPPGEPTDPPSDASGEPTDPPTDPSGEPTDPPTDPGGEPTDPPTDPGGEPTDPPTDPSGEPTDPPTDPSGEPTPVPSPDPTPDPTGSPDPSPTPGPGVTPDPESTEEPTQDPTDEPTEEPADVGEDGSEDDGEETRPRNPFPTRAYGTTVEPVSFLVSLGLVMVAPSQCAAP